MAGYITCQLPTIGVAQSFRQWVYREQSDLQGTLLYIFQSQQFILKHHHYFVILQNYPRLAIQGQKPSQQIILVSELILVWNVCLLSVNVDSDVKNPQSSIFTVVMNLYSTRSCVIYNYEFRYLQ